MGMASGFLDFLRIGDGVKKGGWGYAQDALRLLMVSGPALKYAGLARIGILRLFEVDPGGNACAVITARAALIMTRVRHFISLGRVAEAVGLYIASAEQLKAFAVVREVLVEPEALVDRVAFRAPCDRAIADVGSGGGVPSRSTP